MALISLKCDAFLLVIYPIGLLSFNLISILSFLLVHLRDQDSLTALSVESFKLLRLSVCGSLAFFGA